MCRGRSGAVCGDCIMVPYFQAEISLELLQQRSQRRGAVLPGSQVEMPSYDSMGLPVYDDEVALFVINRDNPQDASYVPNTVEAEGVQVEAHVASALQMLVEAAAGGRPGPDLLRGVRLLRGTGAPVSRSRVEQLQSEEGLTTVMARTQARLDGAHGRGVRPCSPACACGWRPTRRPSGIPAPAPGCGTTWVNTALCSATPSDKEEYTGCTEDLTVIRYVGSGHATAMQQLSMCLEEYVSYLASQG